MYQPGAGPPVADAPEGIRMSARPLDHRLFVRLAGEVAIKSPRTRRRFLQVLVGNLKQAFRQAGIRTRLSSQWSHLLVDTDQPERARQAAMTVFGVRSIDEAIQLGFRDLDDLVAQLAPIYRDRVSGRSFAVRPSRTGSHRFSSQDLGRELGAALRPHAAAVDLDAPEVEVTVKVIDQRAFAIGASTPGPGGLPIGTGGTALALFSGGFDSPVAAWRTLRRGVAIELLVCDLGGCGQIDEALAVARALALRWMPGHEVRAHVVDLAPVVGALVREVEPRLRQLLLKRAMYRAGAALARELRAEALVTGESLAQVSTQTLRNLAVAEAAIGLPVLRPLIGMDKEETIALARRIGTHDLSATVKEHCAIATGRVETWAAPAEIASAEQRAAARDAALQEPAIARAVASRRVVELRTWRPGLAGLPEHVVEQVPRGAVVVDVREPAEGHLAGDLRIPMSAGPAAFDRLAPDRTYVLVCSHGTRSEILARELRARGIDARSLAGGLAQLAEGMPDVGSAR
jgi:thiamine biosynthesis protein ThiI